jgi:hypothetical protein
MAGLSSRFFREGYTLPKFQLPLFGRSVFFHAIRSFKHYFEEDHFIFIFRSGSDTRDFINKELARLGVRHHSLIELPFETSGQAHTVYLGTQGLCESESVYIFNIDTIRPDFRKPEWTSQCDGYLEVFHADGDHWSFVEAGRDGIVVRTTEKNRISDLCSDGLYYFRSLRDFNAAFRASFSAGTTMHGEYYVAPLYNYLISKGRYIRYQEVKSAQLLLCGTPSEYQELQTSKSAFQALSDS